MRDDLPWHIGAARPGSPVEAEQAYPEPGNRPEATEPPSVTGGYLGNDFLNKYRVVIDFASRTLHVQKSG